jgi:E3 ubiquitin-protein ligase RNF115/126/E3 ubiquitin-protein ligase RNF38/44
VLFYCFECRRMVDLHAPMLLVPPNSPHRVCPGCSRGFPEENPPPPSSPPPPGSGSGSGSSSSELSDDPEVDDDADLLGADYGAGGVFLRRFVRQGYQDDPLRNVAAAATLSALRRHPQRRGLRYAFNEIIQRHLDVPPAPAAAAPAAAAAARGWEPPAPATSIAALPTVEVADPAAACAICKEDLPIASQARKLPCAHLYHSSCIVTWLELHNSCPVCRFRIPGHEGPVAPSEPDSPTTRITIRFTTSTRRRSRVLYGDAAVPAPISASPTQLAQAVTGDGAGGPANSGETVSSEWPRHPESDAVMSEAREEDDSFEF